MTALPIRSDEPVTLIGGGPLRPEDLREVRALAPKVIAADGGADRALAAGAVPDAVIGDLDSLSTAARTACAPGTLHHIPEQDTTDFEKCLSRMEAPLVLALGVVGRRLDHTLAAFSVLARLPQRRCIIIGRRDVVTLVPKCLALDLAAGTRVSLHPLAPVEGQGTGLKWPINGLEFAPIDQIGTSNEATGPVTLSCTAPRMLLLLPRSCLQALVEGVRTAQPWG